MEKSVIGQPLLTGQLTDAATRTEIERLSATAGMSVEEARQTDYAPYIDSSIGFELQPFDAAKSNLHIMGNGRLATLVPAPVVFENAEISETLSPLLAYWRDSRGEWQIMQ